MNASPSTLARLALVAWMTAAATAQAAPPEPSPAKDAPRSAQEEAGEPQAQTSGGGESPAIPAPSAPAPAGQAPAGPVPATKAAAKTPAAKTPPAATPAAATSPVRDRQKPAGVDRLDLGTATVTGDREQPKVMYVVPWKKADIGDLSGKPMNSLLDEALAPVDRDEFKREVVYYQAIHSDAAQQAAPRPAAAQGEK